MNPNSSDSTCSRIIIRSFWANLKILFTVKMASPTDDLYPNSTILSDFPEFVWESNFLTRIECTDLRESRKLRNSKHSKY